MRNRTPTTATRFCFMSMVLEAISEKRIYKLAVSEGFEPSLQGFKKTLSKRKNPFGGPRAAATLRNYNTTKLAGVVGIEPTSKASSKL